MDVPKQSEPPHPMALFEQGYVNAMTHFYRGELGRIMVWRQRLDTTTNWAITATTTIFTVAFTVRDLPHIIFFFNVVVLWVLLWIEARRYRFYDAFRARVRMLEAHFLVPMVLENKQMLQGDWKKLICEDLILPSFKISKFEAVGRRLKRNYAFLFLIVLTAWTTKIVMHSPEPVTSAEAFYRALSVNHIPSWIVAVLFLGTLVTVLGINTYIARCSAGEISEFGGRKEAWRI
jgi:uncharacterized membrane protein